MSQITIDLNAELAGKMEAYIKFFGNKEMLFEKFIEFHRNKLKKEIARIQIDLADYENKHGLTSSAFFEQFENGLLGDEPDFIIWAGIY
jgi:hypothetical protein